MNETRRHELIRGLRAAADHYESHPELPAPVSNVTLMLFANTRDEAAKYARMVGGEKSDDGPDIRLRRKFSDCVSLAMYVPKIISCDKVKTGTKIIPATAEKVLPATPEQEIDVYEWHCPDSLLGLGQIKETQNVGGSEPCEVEQHQDLLSDQPFS